MEGGKSLNMGSNDTLIENIKLIIEDKGIKQCKVASGIGMSSAEFSRLLAGKRIIRACYIPAIAAALGVTPNDLFEMQEG